MMPGMLNLKNAEDVIDLAGCRVCTRHRPIQGFRRPGCSGSASNPPADTPATPGLSPRSTCWATTLSGPGARTCRSLQGKRRQPCGYGIVAVPASVLRAAATVVRAHRRAPPARVSAVLREWLGQYRPTSLRFAAVLAPSASPAKPGASREPKRPVVSLPPSIAARVDPTTLVVCACTKTKTLPLSKQHERK